MEELLAKGGDKRRQTSEGKHTASKDKEEFVNNHELLAK